MRAIRNRRSLPARTGLAVIAAFSTVGPAACGGDTAGTEAGTDVEDVAEEDAVEGPFEGSYDTAFYEDLESYVGEEVTLTADVNEVITPAAFTIAGTDDTSVESLLVVGATEDNELASETTVEVTGTVGENLVVTEVEEELGIDLDDELFAEWEEEHYVMAEDVEVLENVD